MRTRRRRNPPSGGSIRRIAPIHLAPRRRLRHSCLHSNGGLQMILHRWRETALVLVACMVAACSKGPQPGQVLDEAKQAGRDGASFKHSADDYFHDMDGAVQLDPAEIAGRNMRSVWRGGTPP